MQSIRDQLKYNSTDEGDIRKTEMMFQMRNNDVTKTLGYADLRYGYYSVMHASADVAITCRDCHATSV